MLEPNSLATVIPFLVPMFSALTCGMILLIGYKDSITGIEKRLKRLLLIYYLSMVLNWFGILIYFIIPPLFVYLNAFIYLAILMIQVVFYHFVYLLTRISDSEHFSLFHYLLPFLISTTLFIWSFFVPFDAQVALIESKSSVLIPGYEAYTRLFTSKIPIRLVYGFVYASLSIHRLIRYYRTLKKHPERKAMRSAHWLVILITMTILLMLMSLSALIMPGYYIYATVFVPLTIFILVVLHIMLLYNIMKRNYLLLPVVTLKNESNTEELNIGHEGNEKQEERTDGVGHKVFEGLNREIFEAYLRKNKPYIRSDFKITDLTEPLGVNRSYLSSFVNKTYGVNFSQFINLCRLHQLEILRGNPVSKGKDNIILVNEAGFGSYRNYQRAKKWKEEFEKGNSNN